MNAKEYYMIRAGLIQWAYRSPIKGRKDAEQSARAVLLFLASVSKINSSHRYTSWYNTESIANAVNLGKRTTYRAIRRLEDQGYIYRYSAREHSTKYELRCEVVSIKDTYVNVVSYKDDSKLKLPADKRDTYAETSGTINKGSIESKGSQVDAKEWAKEGLLVFTTGGNMEFRESIDDVLDTDRPADPSRYERLREKAGKPKPQSITQLNIDEE